MPNTTAVDDVYQYLKTQNVAGTSTWDLITRRMNDTAKDQVVVIQEDGGELSEMPAAAGIGDSAVRNPGVQVQVRAAAWDGNSSFSKAEEIRALLHGKVDLVLQASGTRYYGIRALTPEPVFAGFDDQGRPTHTIAFRLLRSA